ncbi:MAG: tetratricopeptide repeat protein [Myxococcota bacterium]
MAKATTEELEDRARRLRALLEREPADATTWFTLGRALIDLRRWDDARDAFREALVHDPEYTAAHRDLGRAHLELGDAEAAARVLDGALELASRKGDLQTRREMEVFLARAEKSLGRPPREAAAPAPAQATDAPRPVNPEAKALYREGFDHFANDRHEEAIALYEKALALDPELAIAWNGLSLAYRQLGQLDQAIAAGRRVIELEPDDALGHTNLSILYMRNGLIPEAEEEKAIAMQLQMRAAGRR